MDFNSGCEGQYNWTWIVIYRRRRGVGEGAGARRRRVIAKEEAVGASSALQPNIFVQSKVLFNEIHKQK